MGKGNISVEAIQKFERQYVGSDKEKQDIKDAYVKCKGNLSTVYKIVPCSKSKADKQRIADIVDKLIKSGEVQTVDKYKYEVQRVQTKPLNLTVPNINNRQPSSSRTTIQNLNKRALTTPKKSVSAMNSCEVPPKRKRPPNDETYTQAIQNLNKRALTTPKDSVSGMNSCEVPPKRKRPPNDETYTQEAATPSANRTNRPVASSTPISSGVNTSFGTALISQISQINNENASNRLQIMNETATRSISNDSTKVITDATIANVELDRKKRAEHGEKANKMKKHTFADPSQQQSNLILLKISKELKKMNDERDIFNWVLNYISGSQNESVKNLSRNGNNIELSKESIPSCSGVIAKAQGSVTVPRNETATSKIVSFFRNYKDSAQNSDNGEGRTPIENRSVKILQNVTVKSPEEGRTENDKKRKLPDEEKVQNVTSKFHIRSESSAKTVTKTTVVEQEQKSERNCLNNVQQQKYLEKTNKVVSEPSTSTNSHKTDLDSTSALKKLKRNSTTVKEVDLIKKLFDEHKNNLSDLEKRKMEMFFGMNARFQSVCLRLVISERYWYNIFDFCREFYPNLDETEVAKMHTFFKEHQIVDTDYSSDPHFLLRYISDKDLKRVCNNLKSLNLDTKQIQQYGKEIEKVMGFCVLVNENFQSAFESTFLAGTFMNPRFASMHFYFSVMRENAVFPRFDINRYVIFPSCVDFAKYSEAKMLLTRIQSLEDLTKCFEIGKKVYKKLLTLKGDNSDERFTEALHLMKFTAKGVYFEALTIAGEKVASKYPEEVQKWLNHMIKDGIFPHKVYRWCYNLILLFLDHLKPEKYENAAKFLKMVLDKERTQKHLSQIYLYRFRDVGRRLVRMEKYNIPKLLKDQIRQLLPEPIRDDFRKIDFQTTNKSESKVQDSIFKFYVDGFAYTGGLTDRSWIEAAFTLFFYDLIYSNKFIPGTFIYDIQSEPLDMYTRYFYVNRKKEIDERLKNIESEWHPDKLVKFAEVNYENHSHEFAVCEVGKIIGSKEYLKIIIDAVGREVLAKIFRLFAENYEEYKIGFPDLLVWNVDQKSHKFVTIKWKTKELTAEQIAWLNCLETNGANVEVCNKFIKYNRCASSCEGKSFGKASTSKVKGLK